MAGNTAHSHVRFRFFFAIRHVHFLGLGKLRCFEVTACTVAGKLTVNLEVTAYNIVGKISRGVQYLGHRLSYSKYYYSEVQNSFHCRVPNSK